MDLFKLCFYTILVRFKQLISYKLIPKNTNNFKQRIFMDDQSNMTSRIFVKVAVHLK